MVLNFGEQCEDQDKRNAESTKKTTHVNLDDLHSQHWRAGRICWISWLSDQTLTHQDKAVPCLFHHYIPSICRTGRDHRTARSLMDIGIAHLINSNHTKKKIKEKTPLKLLISLSKRRLSFSTNRTQLGQSLQFTFLKLNIAIFLFDCSPLHFLVIKLTHQKNIIQFLSFMDLKIQFLCTIVI
jgi:hypothetical protein